MYFRKFAAKNFGPFTALDFDLAQGSIGIFGPNGAGKSTFFNALYALPTNDFSRFGGGVKIDRIRSTSDKKEASYIYGEIVHDGHVLEITRSLRPSKHCLVIDGGAPITNDNKIAEELQRILKISPAMFDMYVFKEQASIFDFLLSTPTERAEAFSVLCRTANCTRIYESLGELLNKDPEINAQIVDNSDELLQEIGELNEQISKLEAGREPEEEHLLNETSLESARAILKKRDRLAQLEEDLAAAEARLPKLKANLREAKEAEEAAAGKLETVETKLKDGRADVISARSALKSMKQYRKYREQKDELEAEKAKLAKRNFSSPEMPKGYKEGIVQELRDELADKQTKLKTAKDSVAKGICQTCKRPFGDANELQKQRTLVETLPAAIDTLIERGQRFRKYEDAVTAHAGAVAEHLREVKTNKKALADLAEMDAPDGDEAELKKLVDDYEAREERVIGLRQKSNEATQATTKAAEALAGCRTRVSEIKTAQEENAVDPDKVEKVEKRMDEHTAATTNLARIDGELRGLKTAAKGKQADLDKLRGRLQRSKKIQRAVRVAHELRTLFHPREGLAKDVAEENLSEMEGDINEGLSQFGDPFWVEAAKDLSFTVHAPGKPPHPALWLSTGQRVILALAFWPAVASLWSADLGILGLDEPTANLDAENRRFLADALSAMTAKVHGRRQVLVVTHDPDLRTSFEQVLDFGS